MFEGFGDPQENWSKLPHDLIAQLPEIETIGEMKVILYVLRHTWGYQDNAKKITMDEFANGRKKRDGSRIDSGTGLSEPTLRAGIEKAIEHGFIAVEIDDSDKGRIKKIYSLRVKDLPPTPKESLPPSEKETIEIKQKKEISASKSDAPKPSKKRVIDPDSYSHHLSAVSFAIQDVTGMDLGVKDNRGRIFKLSKELIDANGYAPADIPAIVRKNFGAGGFYYATDWRGKKGQRPTLKVIGELWKQWDAVPATPATKVNGRLEQLKRVLWGENGESAIDPENDGDTIDGVPIPSAERRGNETPPRLVAGRVE